jgi:hypothetical protein
MLYVWEGLPQYACIRLADEKKYCVEDGVTFLLAYPMLVTCPEVIRRRNNIQVHTEEKFTFRLVIS